MITKVIAVIIAPSISIDNRKHIKDYVLKGRDMFTKICLTIA